MSATKQPITPPDVVVPHSLVRQLTDLDPASFYRVLSCWQLATAFGLLTLIDKHHPDKEVVVRPREILRIVLAARIIERSLTSSRGAERDIPKKSFDLLNDALLTLFRTEILIKVEDGERTRQERQYRAHFLDSFAYVYRDKQGDVINLDLTDEQKINVRRKDSKDDSDDESRPVFKLPGRQRPWRIAFRLNSELARELARRGHRTIYFGKVFGLLRHLSHDPAAIRVALWIIACRERRIRTNRNYLYRKLIAGTSHHTIEERDSRIDAVLSKLAAEGVVSGIEEHEYAARSRHHEKKYLVVCKADAWHVPNSRDPGGDASVGTSIQEVEVKTERGGLSKTKPPLCQKTEKERQCKRPSKTSNNRHLEDRDSGLGGHTLRSGGTYTPVWGDIREPTTPAPDPEFPEKTHVDTLLATCGYMRRMEDALHV